MKIYLSVFCLVIVGISLSTPARANGCGAFGFLCDLPDAMICKGTYVKAIANQRTNIEGDIKIVIGGKETDKPVVEVFAPLAIDETIRHFKIGDGYQANLDQKDGRYDYFLIPEARAFAYLQVLPFGDQKLTENDYLRQRDAGALVGFSENSISLRSFRSIELKECVASAE